MFKRYKDLKDDITSIRQSIQVCKKDISDLRQYKNKHQNILKEEFKQFIKPLLKDAETKEICSGIGMLRIGDILISRGLKSRCICAEAYTIKGWKDPMLEMDAELFNWIRLGINYSK